MPWATALLGLLVYHRMTIASGLNLVQADHGDSRFVAFVLEHWNSVIDGHALWRSPPIFFPVKGTLGYSDALLAMGLLHALLRHMGLGIFSAMNAGLLLWSVLAFAACYAFLRQGFDIGRPASSLGAFFFAFGWPRFAQLVHLQLQFSAPLPLMALLALRFLRDGLAFTRVYAFGVLAGFMLLTALLLATTAYFVLFFGLALVITILLCLVSYGARRHLRLVLHRHAISLAAAALLLTLLLAPIAQVYLPVMRRTAGRPWPEVASFLPSLPDLFWMGRENLAWGWLFARFPLEADHNWAEGRIGIGLIATFAWMLAVAWAIRRLYVKCARPGATPRDSVVALVILTGALLQISMLRLPGGFSLWWPIYEFVPGMQAIRAVERLQLIVMLPMALALAVIAQHLWEHRWRRPVLRPALLLLLCVGVAEQFGSTYAYSGHTAEALARRVAEAVPVACRAFYVVASADLIPTPPVISSEADFDAKAYLQANPDVARTWGGSSWEHYTRFGRSEGRFLDPAMAQRRQTLIYFYAYTVPLAAVLAGKPTVNGLSGWEPPGYDLGDVFAPDAPERLARWLSRESLPAGSVCTVPVRLDFPDLPEWLQELW